MNAGNIKTMGAANNPPPAIRDYDEKIMLSCLTTTTKRRDMPFHGFHVPSALITPKSVTKLAVTVIKESNTKVKLFRNVSDVFVSGLM